MLVHVRLNKKDGTNPTQTFGLSHGYRAARKQAGHNFAGAMAQIADLLAEHLDNENVEAFSILVDKQANEPIEGAK